MPASANLSEIRIFFKGMYRKGYALKIRSLAGLLAGHFDPALNK